MKEIVPTTENVKLINMKTVQREERDAFAKNIEKISEDKWKLVIDKPCVGKESEDYKVRQLVYDVRNYIFKKYQVMYWEQMDEKWVPIPNKHINNILLSAYAVVPTGLWGIYENQVFFLDAESNELIMAPKKISNVLEMEVLPEGRLHLSILESVKLVEKNRFYSYSQGDYEGYYDEYELTIKNIFGRTDGLEKRLEERCKEAKKRGEEDSIRKEIENWDEEMLKALDEMIAQSEGEEA